ncbi:MAG: DUF4430 domain-containing protein [Christensenellales bacterium]|jgi:hypothetical protein
MKKDILLIGFIVLIVALLVSGTKIQSVEEYYLTHIDDVTPDSETVSLSIFCGSVFKNWDRLDPALKNGDYIPSDGNVLEKTEYVLRPGDTAFDLLDRAVRHHKIQMEYQGLDANIYKAVYIKGIHYLYEFSCGPHSGWMFMVNGEYPLYGCDQYLLKDGDYVEWIYTCDLGNDIGPKPWAESGGM